MYQPKKQLTAEEISRAKDRAQAKRDRKKQVAARLKEERISADFGINSADATSKWDEKTPDQEWIIQEDPGRTSIEVARGASEANTGWPWVGVPEKLLTQAPYALNEHNDEVGFFSLPQEVQVVKLPIKD
jgi:hypothetical protein